MRKVLFAGIATAALALAAPAFAGSVNSTIGSNIGGGSHIGAAVSNNDLTQTVTQGSTNTNNPTGTNAGQTVGGAISNATFTNQIMNNNALNSGVNQLAAGQIAVSAGVGQLGSISTTP